jgi:Arc/MetJ-type ribon-helix-helix transcriptional regulator
MTVDLTPAQEAFIRKAISNGRFARPEDAVSEALLLWEEHERHRSEFLASLDDAKASLDRGEGIPISPDSMHALAQEVKSHGRERLAAERQHRDR